MLLRSSLRKFGIVFCDTSIRPNIHTDVLTTTRIYAIAVVLSKAKAIEQQQYITFVEVISGAKRNANIYLSYVYHI